VARLAVDAGTWSVAAMLADQDGGRRVVPDPVTSLPWSRSSVARGPAGGWLVGESAERIRPLRAGLYRDDVKRLLDSDEPVYLDGAPYRAEELLAQLIWQRAAQAWTMTDESVDELVLGVPASFEGTRKEAVREAARLAGFRGEGISLVLEPAAAAQAALRGLRQTGTFLVFDLGGGTLDCSLVTAKSGAVQVIDSVGDASVGGFRIDAAIVDYLRSRFSLPEASGGPADDLGESDLLAAARAMKHQLSQDNVAYARNLLPDGDRQFTLTRADLEHITQPVMDAAIACCESLLKANNLDWPTLVATIATGGATRSPVIAKRLEQITTLITPTQPPELVTVEGLLPPGDKHRIHARRLPAIRSVHTLSGPPAAFNAVAFSPDDTLVAAGSDDGSIRVWETATANPCGRPLAGPQGHTGKVLAVSFWPDGSLLASGGEDEKIRLWDLRSMMVHGAVLTSGVGLVNALVFTLYKGEPGLAAAGNKTKVELWDPATAKMLRRLDTSPAGPLASLAAWPERGVLVACGGTNSYVYPKQRATEQLYLWESEDFNFRNITIRESGHDAYHGHVPVDWSTLYSTGKHLDATGLLAVALSPDGATVAVGSRNGVIRVWKLSEELATATVLTGHREQVTGLAWNPDGSLLASAGSSLRIWEPTTRVSRILTDHTAGLTGVQFSHDGTLIATSSRDNTVRIWGIG
jgi:WD40 repeat protein/actin-like ATPase involved in cell morphogenesis